jgi:hypothetical protein
MQSSLKRIIQLLAAILAVLFLISAAMNLGAKIPVGFATLSFSVPSSSIATFEIVIGALLLAAAALSNLYVFGAAYLLATVGVAEGLLSSSVQGLARSLHETMIPFLVAGIVVLVLDARATYNKRAQDKWNFEITAILQFFVGGLVTLGGAAYARSGTYPVGTALGLGHLAIGLAGLYGGYAFMKRKSRSPKFLIWINSVTIIYSAIVESLAEIYAYLPPGINDALIGTIVAIIVSSIIIYRLATKPKLFLVAKLAS